MTPFDLEKAKKGAKVCTRDGRKVRILAFDLQNREPICAAILEGNYEFPTSYFPNGKFTEGDFEHYYDLMMVD